MSSCVPDQEARAELIDTGVLVQIEGEIRTREYTPNSGKNGGATKKSIIEVRLQSIVKLDRPKKANSTDEQGAAA